MQEYEEIIEKALEQHRYIDENLNTAENKMSDINTLVAIQRERSEIARSSLDDLQSKLKKVQQHIESLHGFILQHFQFEESTFSKLLDSITMQELLREHQEMDAKFEEIKSTLSDSEKKEMDNVGLLETQYKIVNMLNDLCYSIRQHAGKEDKLLHDLDPKK